MNRYSTFLFTVLVLTLGFGQLLRFELWGVPVYLHDILVIFLFVALLPASKRTFLDRRPEQSSSLPAQAGRDTEGGRRVLIGTTGIRVFLFGLTVGWIYALTQYSIFEILVPLLYTLRLLAYFALYLVIQKSKIQIPSSIFLSSGLTTLSLGLVQYFLLPDMRIFQQLGWDDHLNRLTLPHFDPTFTAVMLSLFLLYYLQRFSILHIPVLFFSTLGILLTYSRSVWLSLAITMLAVIRPKKYLLFLIPLFLIAIFLLPKRFGEGTNLLRTYSIESRFSSDLEYVRKYNYSLLIGRGLNTLMLDSGAGERPNHATGPNNSYLYIFATTGLIGLIGWVLIWRDIYLSSRYKPMLLFFFLASLFNNVMLYPFALLWVLLIESDI